MTSVSAIDPLSTQPINTIASASYSLMQPSASYPTETFASSSAVPTFGYSSPNIDLWNLDLLYPLSVAIGSFEIGLFLATL